ncbi:MAG: hypothetical protein F6J93_30900 [Oscillatoria sp. SIO1A7]|nr:hypothetical protein [Oscillatoria sp. SIO1A7]
MATVAAVYTIEPFKRTAEKIMKPEKYEKIKRPKPESKRVWASLTKEPEAIINEAFDEGLYRDSNQEKNWVALVDGNKTQLQLIKELSQHYKKDVTIILDLIHVIEYLWKAAFAFHTPTSKEAEDWVEKRILRIRDRKIEFCGFRNAP